MELIEPPRVNVADRLSDSARILPEVPAVVEAWGNRRSITFAELDRDADMLARGLVEIGVEPQLRMALLVKPSIKFVTLVFALLRSGATMILVDAGLGARNIVHCLQSTNPDGFVAIPIGQALRVIRRSAFPKAKINVTVGRRIFWGGKTFEGLANVGVLSDVPLPHTAANDSAAIVFTSGSTGPPKGVVYRHETFATQLTEIERVYDLKAGGVDLACFPLFGLFNVALGITTVLPDMDFSRPAAADPKKLL
ncbi:MAG: AMP-binding protein, partial [Aeoliella sp.]